MVAANYSDLGFYNPQIYLRGVFRKASWEKTLDVHYKEDCQIHWTKADVAFAWR